MGERANEARELFLSGYNCAQAVLLPFCAELGLDEKTAARIASSFGGGMGRMRLVCGAVSAMFMAAGIARGYDDPKDRDGKKRHYAFIQELAHDFSGHFGSIICAELLNSKDTSPTPGERTKEYYAERSCPACVEFAARLIEEKVLG